MGFYVDVGRWDLRGMQMAVLATDTRAECTALEARWLLARVARNGCGCILEFIFQFEVVSMLSW